MIYYPPSHNPELRLSFNEYYDIPRAEDMPEGFLKTCPIGTRFKCKGSKTIENTVIGIVVKGEDALAHQYGAGLLSVPERFVNRYKPVVDDPAIDYQI